MGIIKFLPVWHTITVAQKTLLLKINMFNKYEEEAKQKGYLVDKDGQVYNKSKKLKGTSNSTGYHVFKIRNSLGESVCVKTHRMQAYQKFGDKIYEDEIVVRHLDSNPLNNSWGNIEIGTQSDNMMDQPKDQRIKKASNANKKYSDELVMEIKAYHNSGHSYKEIMEKYNINSKGTLSYIINNR